MPGRSRCGPGSVGQRSDPLSMDQRAVVECVQVLLTETIRTRSPGTATRSVDEATSALDPAPDGAFAVEAAPGDAHDVRPGVRFADVRAVFGEGAE